MGFDRGSAMTAPFAPGSSSSSRRTLTRYYVILHIQCSSYTEDGVDIDTQDRCCSRLKIPDSESTVQRITDTLRNEVHMLFCLHDYFFPASLIFEDEIRILKVKRCPST